MNPLGAARLRCGSSIEAVATRTRISARYIRAMDDGRFAELPAGLYARAYVRAFAAAVGLDESELEPILPLLPPAVDPLPVIKEGRTRSRGSGRSEQVLRLCAAASLDAVLLLTANAAAVVLVAAACRAGSRELLEAAPVPLLLVWATTWVEYFVLFAGIHGRTAGEFVCGLPRRRTESPLRLPAILRRAVALSTPALSSAPALGHPEGSASPA